MVDTAPSAKLTFDGAQKLLAAAIAKAKEINQPQCICIVDSGGHLLTMARMDGAFALSVETALRNFSVARLAAIIEQLATAALDTRKQSTLAAAIAQRTLMAIAANAKRRG